MDFKKYNKKGQAAIEFLMTYGWMLLVVLIVGALVFSFVDFGSLLPAKVDMTSSTIRGDPTASSAYSSQYVTASEQNIVYIGFTYVGANRNTINISDISIKNTVGNYCEVLNITNDVTSEGSSSVPVAFLNGHLGTIKFDCDGVPPASETKVGNLFQGDVFEGTLSIGTKDTKRNNARVIPNTGTVRLSIQ